jgi:hypothetical protein
MRNFELCKLLNELIGHSDIFNEARLRYLGEEDELLKLENAD